MKQPTSNKFGQTVFEKPTQLRFSPIRVAFKLADFTINNPSRRKTGNRSFRKSSAFEPSPRQHKHRVIPYLQYLFKSYTDSSRAATCIDLERNRRAHSAECDPYISFCESFTRWIQRINRASHGTRTWKMRELVFVEWRRKAHQNQTLKDFRNKDKHKSLFISDKSSGTVFILQHFPPKSCFLPFM